MAAFRNLTVKSSNFSIVIPTLNEEKYLGRLMAGLEKQTLKPREIIIVDGRSDDKTVDIARHFREIKLKILNPSTAGQRNWGGFNAVGEIIFFLDADVNLHPSFIKDCLYEFNRRSLDLACPLFIAESRNIFVYLLYIFFNLIFVLSQKILPSGAGMCIVIKSDVFKKTKGFNSEFKFEDIEFIRRAGSKYKFGIITTRLGVSDRRFVKFGVLKTTLIYMLLSFLFMFNQFKIANTVSYQFGRYNDK